MGIDFTKPTPLYKQIAADIRAKILSGALHVGDPVGTHQQLARQYGVSLITIKKALFELINEGMLYSRVGKGTFVAEKSEAINFSKYKTIGFILRDLESPFFSRILSSVEKNLSDRQINLLLSSTANRYEKEESQIQNFLRMGVSGLIIASMSHVYDASPVIRKLHGDNFPYVIVSFIADKNVYYIGTDHEEGGFMATEHLIQLGYRKLGYINGEAGNILGEVRKAGFLKALKKYSMPFNPDLIYQLRLRGEWFDYQSGYEIGEHFASLTNRPEAVFVYNDLAALGFEKAILDKGLTVPGDIAIVGFDDITLGTTATVPLTTIHQPADQIGALAVETVLKRIEGRPVPLRQIFKPVLITRETCGARLKK